MKVIKADNRPELDLDDIIIYDDTADKKTKKKKDNYKKHNKKKNKSKKNKKKKSNKKKKQTYTYKSKGGFFSRLSDSVNVYVKSKVKVDITDKTIDSILNTGFNIIRCILNKGK